MLLNIQGIEQPHIHLEMTGGLRLSIPETVQSAGSEIRAMLG
jgi:hypothetical protein